MRRIVLALALVAACDKGKVEPTKGSAEPAPLPVPDPAPPPVDAMSIDEQILTNNYNPDEHVLIRACNDTGKDMSGLTYHEKFVEGALPKKGCTPFRETQRAYSYTYAEFTLGKADKFVIQPIDYMGETPLAGGHWSFHIKVEDYANRIASIRAEKESDTAPVRRDPQPGGEP
jgi:hypothetical protein